MKLLAQFIAGLVGSIVFGIVGLAMGADLGGNFGFPAFGGNAAGYESGGAFFAIIGISFGALLGLIVINKLLYRRQATINGRTTSVPVTLIATIIVAIVDLVLFDYHLPPAVDLIILLLPTIVLTTLFNKGTPPLPPHR